MNSVRRHITVTGRVQGVGYRYFVLDKAQELGLTGWVRNAENGNVEIEAQGETVSIEALCRTLETGPPLSRIDQVVVIDHPADDSDRGFSIRH